MIRAVSTPPIAPNTAHEETVTRIRQSLLLTTCGSLCLVGLHAPTATNGFAPCRRNLPLKVVTTNRLSPWKQKEENNSFASQIVLLGNRQPSSDSSKFSSSKRTQKNEIEQFVYGLNDQRYAASDWTHNMKSIPRSTILRDIRGPVATIFIWSVFVSSLYKALVRLAPPAARFICIPSTPHSLMVSALGLLLVFRTNSAYQRFVEGRRIWEQILSVSRNLSRMACLYEDDLTTPRKLRIFRLLGAYPYLLNYYIQQMETPIGGTRVRPTTRSNPMRKLWPRGRLDTTLNMHPPPIELPVQKMNKSELPWSLLPPKARALCFESANPPMWVCDRLSQEVVDVEYSENFTSRERFAFLSSVDKLTQAVGQCERIHQTGVPQNYARHSLRSLTIWLLTFPFAIVQEVGWLTGPVMAVTAWLFFGVYQIGAVIEDPFQGSLRLQSLCDAIYNDVMYQSSENQANPRETAFDAIVLPTSSLSPHAKELDEERGDGQVSNEATRRRP